MPTGFFALWLYCTLTHSDFEKSFDATSTYITATSQAVVGGVVGTVAAAAAVHHRPQDAIMQ